MDNFSKVHADFGNKLTKALEHYKNVSLIRNTNNIKKMATTHNFLSVGSDLFPCVWVCVCVCGGGGEWRKVLSMVGYVGRYRNS